MFWSESLERLKKSIWNSFISLFIMEYPKMIILTFLIVLPISSALVTYSINSDHTCIGSLVISYEDEEANIDILTLEGPRNAYSNLRRGFPVMRSHSISHIETFGNCCWKIYPERQFEGEAQIIFPGSGTIYVDFQPVSIKKLECAY